MMVIIGAIALRQIRLVMALVFVTALNLWVLISTPTLQRASGSIIERSIDDPANTIRIVHANIGRQREPETILPQIKSIDADIVFFRKSHRNV